ncbi:MAG: bifunctional adenosylcobinamide kinase/adenosylcobinamide-phosphate guanylyltransferase [Chloroflexota bacterium]
MKTTLIIGGARSGKSRLAQTMALDSGREVLFVATAEARDEEMRRRIEEHRKTRPSGWTTLEATGKLGERIARNIGRARTVVIDCVTLLVNNVFEAHGGSADLDKEVMAEIEALIDCTRQVEADFIIVTNEVGLGIIPGDRTSRLYRDVLGRANQRLAAHADEVLLLVAGIPLAIKKAD